MNMNIKIEVSPVLNDWVLNNPAIKEKVDQMVINQLCQDAVTSYLEYLYMKELPYQARLVIDGKYGVITKKATPKKNPMYERVVDLPNKSEKELENTIQEEPISNETEEKSKEKTELIK